MLNLILAVVSSSLLAIILRFSETKKTTTYGVCLFNYLTCCVEGYFFTGGGNPFAVSLPVLGISVITGATLLLSLALYKVNIANNGTVLSAVFSKLGILIPTLLSITVFGEKASIVQFIGIALAVAAILVINLGKGKKSESKTENTKKSKLSFLTHGAIALIILMVIGGLCDSMSKVYEYNCPRDYDNQYLFLGFAFAGVFTLIMLILKKEKISFFDIIFGVLVGIPNYFVSRFLLKALVSVPAFIVYPSYSVGTVVLITVLSLFLFKEKLARNQIIGIVMILAALVLLNV